jgi:hypothetical protein
MLSNSFAGGEARRRPVGMIDVEEFGDAEKIPLFRVPLSSVISWVTM